MASASLARARQCANRCVPPHELQGNLVTADKSKKRRARHVASDEAHAWARSLPLNNPNAKTVLRALALYIDGEGRAFVGIDQLSEDTDLSADTVRRRLVWLEQVGAIVRLPQWLDANGMRNGEGRGKRTTDLIGLLVQADIDEIERLTNGDGRPENIENSPTETTPFSPSTEQGLNSEAETVSPRLAPRQPSQSCDHLISEPEPESSPQPPSGGRLADEDIQERQASEPEHFAYFRNNYPDRENWAWSKVLPTFASLSPMVQERAAAASPDYAKKIAATKRKPPPVRPERFLKDRIFDNFPNSKLPEKPRELPPKAFYPEGSEVCTAIKAVFAIARLGELRTEWFGDIRGVWRRGEIGRDLLAMAAFQYIDPDELPEILAEGSQQFASWRNRIKQWTGIEPTAKKIWTEPHDPSVHDLPYTHPKHRWRNHVMGLRAPQPFPPRVDGSWPEPLQLEEAPTADATGPPQELMTPEDAEDFK